MTENKRFKAIGKEIWQDNRIWCVCGGEHCADVIATAMNELLEEKEQYKQSATMYHNLFVELQKRLKGVKKASDLDNKDFEGLIELSKGNVFDDKLGWIHLPVKEGFK